MDYRCRLRSLGNCSCFAVAVFIFVPAVLLSIFTGLLAFFLRLYCLSYSILDVPMHKYCGQHSCTSSTFSIAILDGSCHLRSAITVNLYSGG